MANPDIQEFFHKLDDLSSFDQVISMLPLDSTGEFYDFVAHNYEVFHTRDKKAKLQKRCVRMILWQRYSTLQNSYTTSKISSRVSLAPSLQPVKIDKNPKSAVM